MRGGEGDLHGWPRWRNACVVRARTIAANIRMIEFAVEGGLAPFGGGARTRVRALETGALAAAGSYVCVNVGEGRMRVLVSAPDGGAAARFMWSLVEGARVRLTVPVAPAQRAAETRLAGAAGVSLGLDTRSRRGDGPRAGLAAQAANDNAPSHRHFSLPTSS